MVTFTTAKEKEEEFGPRWLHNCRPGMFLFSNQAKNALMPPPFAILLPHVPHTQLDRYYSVHSVFLFILYAYMQPSIQTHPCGPEIKARFTGHNLMSLDFYAPTCVRQAANFHQLFQHFLISKSIRARSFKPKSKWKLKSPLRSVEGIVV